MQSFQMKVSGDTVFVNVSTSVDSNANINAPIHHVLVLDGSGSMSGSAKTLHAQTLTIIDELVSKDDELSIIQFSGQGDYKVILLNGQKADLDNSELDRLSRVHGTTCFSSPFEHLERHLVDKDGAKLVITLLTDGCPVVPWSDTDELEKVCAAIQGIADHHDLVAVNTIGYGSYYNKAFCYDVTRFIGNGEFNHSSNLEMFLQQYSKYIETAKDSSSTRVVTEGELIAHVTPTTVLTGVTELYSNLATENKFISITSAAQFDLDTQSNIQDIDTIKYALALAYYENNNRMNALDIVVNSLRDKYIADLMINAFTRDEVQEVIEKLRNAVLDTSARQLEGACSVGYIPKKDAFCLIDLFKLAEVENVTYLPFNKDAQKYERIGVKTTDNYDQFVPSNIESTEASFEDLVWNSERMNLSVKFDIHGKVSLNPVMAKNNNLPKEYDTKIYRTHTFVKDGVLNINQAIFKVPQDSKFLTILRDNKIAYEVTGSMFIDGENEGQFDTVLVQLNKLPMVNRNYASLDLNAIYDLVHETTVKEARVKIIKEFIESAIDSKASAGKVGEFQKLTLAQIDVLKSHGISAAGVYQGIDNSRPTVEESDYYEARKLEFELAGFSSLPTTASVQTKIAAKKPLTPREQLIYESIGIYADKTANLTPKEIVTQLSVELKELRASIKNNNATLSAAKVAKIIVNDWWTGSEINDKGTEFFTPKVGAISMNIKAARTRVYI